MNSQAPAVASQLLQRFALDPVTFEVLKNAFVSIVNQMGEQILRTCYSYVIYNRDFSNAINDMNGESVAQGDYDLAGHVGTLHFTAKEILRVFGGALHPGDVYAVNDPYAGGTHFPDIRLLRPIFVDGEPIAFSQSNGHWTDVGGAAPGSFDVEAKDMFREGIRITPIRLWRGGEFCDDVAHMIASNTRDPDSIIGDMQAQAQATLIAEREIQRLAAKYGRDTVVAGFSDVQDYVERSMRARLANLPNGTWESVDYIDHDPSAGEGLVPIHMKLTISGSETIYDFTGSHPCIGSLYNSAFGTTFSAVVAGMKTFFPDLPLNSGFYRTIKIIAPEDTVVSARWPVAVTGFLMPFEKIQSMTSEIWSRIVPERAMACSFNTEYLLTGGRDLRSPEKRTFMFYDWLPGGWGGRNGRDGAGVSASRTGAGLRTQLVEGQERLCPIQTERFDILIDSGGPGKWRGGVGVVKASTLLNADKTVMSYFCDRERAVVWGINGGLPSIPHGLTLYNEGDKDGRWLGSVFSNYKLEPGDTFSRPTAGGGGYGDPLERDPELVRDDVADGYVSIVRALKDYGVVVVEKDAELAEYGVDLAATERERAKIGKARLKWLEEDPKLIARRYQSGDIEMLDVLRRHAVILEWGAGELLPKTTRQYRALFRERTAAFW